jgi:MtN3 and saliva related transmembrane protein
LALLVDITGYTATVVGTALMLPQLVQSWRTKKVEDLSGWMLVLYFLNCGLWGVYGYLISATPVLVANVVGFALSILLLAMKVAYTRRR